jgi:peptidoglycan/xylan/chitin deacetylase (PgdA/CDA1 family)
MKRLVKQAVQGVAPYVAPPMWRLRQRPSLLVLMYHRVLPLLHPARETEQPGMYVSPQALAMHLEVLRREATLMHLDDWLDAVAAGQSVPRSACAITFDDGWLDNHQYAFPVLKQAQAPATIYLVSDLVGTRYSFWPNDLARILASSDAHALSRMPQWMQQLIRSACNSTLYGKLDALQIDAVIAAAKAAHTDAEMLAVIDLFERRESSAERELMNWEEIREMNASGLVRFGSHTRRHTRLSGVASDEALRDEVVGSRRAIEQHLGAPPRTFCYPNGDTSRQAIDLVRSAYSGAVTTASGWHSPQSDPFLIRRVGVHEAVSSRGALFARISGWI